MPAPRPAPQPSVTGSVVALVAGVLLLLPAVGLGTGGAVLLAVDAARDSAGYVTSPVQQASGSDSTTLQWTATDGEYAVVVANVTGASGVSVDVVSYPRCAAGRRLAGRATDPSYEDAAGEQQ